MDVSDLKVFEAVARLGSMNRAAQALHTVQSNVTARVRALEGSLGVTLFQRHARGVTMTPAGERLLPFVGRMTQLLADARTAVVEDGVPKGTLHLGSLETTTALRLAPVLGDFARTYPAVRLVVTTGTSRRLLDDVLDRRVEGAFVAGPVDHPDVHQEVVFREELVLVTTPAIRAVHELKGIPDLRTVVFQMGCSYRQRLESVLADAGIVTAKPLEFGSLDAILSCVSAGIGVTLLPRGVVAVAEREGRVAIHALPSDRAWVDTLFIRRNDAYVSSAMRAFVETARADMSRTDR
ncbi:LysR family transcriptional regulator [Pararobbsia silviterrae]|uniref:LysR family transcriptional regulator n=1 Tax=Pararobbsia silviterrae TaxID=1792498 RepID=A0A494YCI3_9BURK|nr:LysR family transcriptional regulator [Pararobbsia silviterrae]RKP57704.1 LysR family transcriptional regulator [Pararobbsia silviterrae]